MSSNYFSMYVFHKLDANLSGFYNKISIPELLGVDVIIISSSNMHFMHCSSFYIGPAGQLLQKNFLHSSHLKVSSEQDFPQSQ